MLREAFRRIKPSERFYQSYGQHIRLIELSIIIMLLTIFEIIIHFLTPVSLGVYIWATILAVVVLTHALIFRSLGRKELYQESLIFLDKYRIYFVAFLMSIFVLLFAASLSLSVYFPQWVKNNGEFFSLADYSLNITIALLFIMIFLLFGSLTRFRKARIYIKLALVKAINLTHTQDDLERKKIIKSLTSLFDTGLKAYNDYLNRSMLVPVSLEGLNEYSKILCCEFLAGKDEGLVVVTDQIQLFLKSLGRVQRKEDLRDALTALKNIKTGRGEKEYPMSELSLMITVVTPTDTLKSVARSPYFAVSLVVIAILLQLFH